MTYSFVGDYSSIGDVLLDEFGKTIELSPDGFKTAILGKSTIIPQSEFKLIGFTAEELKAKTASDQMYLPDSFHVKRRRALARVAEYHEHFDHGTPLPQFAPIVNLAEPLAGEKVVNPVARG